jgi:hypothetical protein
MKGAIVFNQNLQRRDAMKNELFLKTKKLTFIIIAFFFLGFLQSCMYYYKVQTIKDVSSKEIRKFDSLNKYLVLHRMDSAWYFTQLKINDTVVSGIISILPGDHRKYKTTVVNAGNRYKNTRVHNESGVLNEIHLYWTDSLSFVKQPGDRVEMRFQEIKKAEVYKKAKGRTTASWVLPAVLGPLVGIPSVIIIGAALSGGGQVSKGD